MPTKVAYERVNLADIETSSEEDDYGDLFAHERRMGHGKSRPLRNLSKKKGGKCMSGSFCWKSLCVVSVVFAILGLLAGVAIYIDPESSFMDLMPKESTVGSSGEKQENTVPNSFGGSGAVAVNGSNLTTAAISTSQLDNAGALLSLTTSKGSSDSVKNQTKSRENPSSDGGSEAVEQENKKTREVVKEGDKSEEEAAKAETLETWSSSSFFSSSSPQNLLKFVSGQSSPKSTGY